MWPRDAQKEQEELYSKVGWVGASLTPSLKASQFQTLILNRIHSAFNLNLVLSLSLRHYSKWMSNYSFSVNKIFTNSVGAVEVQARPWR